MPPPITSSHLPGSPSWSDRIPWFDADNHYIIASPFPYFKRIAYHIKVHRVRRHTVITALKQYLHVNVIDRHVIIRACRCRIICMIDNHRRVLVIGVKYTAVNFFGGLNAGGEH